MTSPKLGRTLLPDLMRKRKKDKHVKFKDLASNLIAIIRDEDPNITNVKKPTAVERDSSALLYAITTSYKQQTDIFEKLISTISIQNSGKQYAANPNVYIPQ